MNLRDNLRRIRRSVFTKGFSGPVHVFLKKLKYSDCRDYFINFSFDLELAYNTAFLEREQREGLRYGQLARDNFEKISRHLNKNGVEYNVQIVGKLLEENGGDLFRLSERQLDLFRGENVEAGLHGFSHRLFTELSKEEADFEISNAVELFKKKFSYVPRFMSFPKNKVAHLEILRQYQIKSWRSDRQEAGLFGEIPLGLWFAPGNLQLSDFKKILFLIKKERKGFLLHLWNHFTEMEPDLFNQYLNIARESGWNFINLKNYENHCDYNHPRQS